jgi:Fe-S-cluster-containing dehydrogenase component
MARMKFLCDAERCIECNGCTVTSKGATPPCRSPNSDR